MAPGYHPPCQPSASCQPVRCHPTPPPCQTPEKCLRTSRKKKVKPCPSAVSILQTQSVRTCSSGPQGCRRFGSVAGKDARNVKEVRKYLKRKSKEIAMRRQDRIKGTNRYGKYMKGQGQRRADRDCCAGHGHRGRVLSGKQNPRKRRCEFCYRCCRCCRRGEGGCCTIL